MSMKTSHSKKYISISLVIAALIITAASLFILCACDINQSVSQQELASSCIRIHIRANSNSNEDQAVKLKVRDAITTYLETLLEGCKSKSDASALLERNSAQLVNIANSTLYANNFEYKAWVRINNEYFPDRVYDDYTFPAGNYDAVIIGLGTGEGDNWWCVAFPPLCFIPDTKGGEKIVYKSWIKEMLDKLFSKH